MALSVLNRITFALVVVDLRRLNVGWYCERQYLQGEGMDALARRRGMTLPFYSFTVWVTSSSIYSLGIMLRGRAIVFPVPNVTTLIGSRPRGLK